MTTVAFHSHKYDYANRQRHTAHRQTSPGQGLPQHQSGDGAGVLAGGQAHRGRRAAGDKQSGVWQRGA